MGGGILALLCASTALFGPGLESFPSPRGEVLAVLPDPYLGGKALGREFFRVLEEEVLPLKPGPVGIEASLPEESPRRGEAALHGLEETLRARGFDPCRAERRSRGRGKVWILFFQARPEREGRLLLTLDAPALDAGPLRVLVDPAPWVPGRSLPPGTFRVSGEWEGSPGEALASARARADRRVRSVLARLLPWRPWKRAFLEKIVLETMEEASFLQMRTTPEGKVWKGWVLWGDAWKAENEASRKLAGEDRRWLLRLGLAGLAALAFWYGSLRLDWATKGFFTFRIRALSFLAWAGACGALLVMV